MKLFFSTIFDINYLSRGLALYESMKRWHSDFVLYIVCLDDEVQNYFTKSKLKNIELVTISEIENYYTELSSVKATRSRIDYIFTLSPYYPSFILKQNPAIPFICSLDCDQYFFNDSSIIFEDLKEHSVLIMPHKFSENLLHFEVYGKYNVSFQVFKNDEIGNNCLALWRSQCLDWCSDVLEDERFADQKYLNTWPLHFKNNVKEISNIGTGLAPWNLGNHKISMRNKNIFVDDAMLILYHYQGLRFVHNNLIYTGLANYHVKPTSLFIRLILHPIIKDLLRYQVKGNADSIKRNLHSQSKSKNLFGHVTSFGMYYKTKFLLINLDMMYKLIIQKKKLNGIYNRFKNAYR